MESRATPRQVAQTQAAVDTEHDDQGQHEADRGGLGGGEDAGVDAGDDGDGEGERRQRRPGAAPALCPARARDGAAMPAEARMDDGVGNEQRREQQPRADAGEEQVDDRFLSEKAIDDHRDGRRDEHPERAAGGEQAESEAPPVAARREFGNGDRAYGGGRRHRRAGDGGEEGAGQDGGDRESSGPVADPALHGGEKPGAGAAVQQHVRHQDEQRHGEQNEIVHARHQRLGDGERRRAVEQQQRRAEAGENEGDIDPGEQQGEQREEDRCRDHGVSRRSSAKLANTCAAVSPSPAATGA